MTDRELAISLPFIRLESAEAMSGWADEAERIIAAHVREALERAAERATYPFTIEATRQDIRAAILDDHVPDAKPVTCESHAPIGVDEAFERWVPGAYSQDEVNMRSRHGGTSLACAFHGGWTSALASRPEPRQDAEIATLRAKLAEADATVVRQRAECDRLRAENEALRAWKKEALQVLDRISELTAERAGGPWTKDIHFHADAIRAKGGES